MGASPTAIIYLFGLPANRLEDRQRDLDSALRSWSSASDRIGRRMSVEWSEIKSRKRYPVVEYWVYAKTENGDELRSLSREDIGFFEDLVANNLGDAIELAHQLANGKKSWFGTPKQSSILLGREALMPLVILLYTHNDKLEDIADAASQFLERYTETATLEYDSFRLPFSDMKDFVSKWLDSGVQGDLAGWLEEARNRL